MAESVLRDFRGKGNQCCLVGGKCVCVHECTCAYCVFILCMLHVFVVCVVYGVCNICMVYMLCVHIVCVRCAWDVCSVCLYAVCVCMQCVYCVRVCGMCGACMVFVYVCLCVLRGSSPGRPSAAVGGQSCVILKVGRV